jgi:hypothetical protein
MLNWLMTIRFIFQTWLHFWIEANQQPASHPGNLASQWLVSGGNFKNGRQISIDRLHFILLAKTGSCPFLKPIAVQRKLLFSGVIWIP